MKTLYWPFKWHEENQLWRMVGYWYITNWQRIETVALPRHLKVSKTVLMVFCWLLAGTIAIKHISMQGMHRASFKYWMPRTASWLKIGALVVSRKTINEMKGDCWHVSAASRQCAGENPLLVKSVHATNSCNFSTVTRKLCDWFMHWWHGTDRCSTPSSVGYRS